jgi:hypothetical protein
VTHGINIAEPFFKFHKMGAFLEESRCLVGEQTRKNFVALVAVGKKKQSQQEMAQVEH